jgi:dipeptidase E
MKSKKILALSSSRSGNSAYLEKAIPLIKDFLGNENLQIAFIPFASVDAYEDYSVKVKEALKNLPYTIHKVDNENAQEVIKKCDAIMVGGGNTFKLLHDLYIAKLIDLIRDKVDAGIPYIGWSAGANILGPTISTTNDMPIVEPKSFNALGLLPFQINPHYFVPKIEGFNGETRDKRLEEFLKMNPGIYVVALPEGSALLLEKEALNYKEGNAEGFLFQLNEKTNSVEKNPLQKDGNINFLL